MLRLTVAGSLYVFEVRTFSVYQRVQHSPTNIFTSAHLFVRLMYILIV